MTTATPDATQVGVVDTEPDGDPEREALSAVEISDLEDRLDPFLLRMLRRPSLLRAGGMGCGFVAVVVETTEWFEGVTDIVNPSIFDFTDVFEIILEELKFPIVEAGLVAEVGLVAEAGLVTEESLAMEAGLVVEDILVVVVGVVVVNGGKSSFNKFTKFAF